MQSQVLAIDAIVGRRSIRRFLPTEVPIEKVKQVLSMASHCASGVNSQPWKVYVVSGAARDRVSKMVRQAADEDKGHEEYPYAPRWFEPYLSRRRKVGYDLYAAYGIAREDMAGRRAAAMRNFDFFGAPVGLFFTMNNKLQYGQWIDNGIFMGTVMTAARALGLDTCPQQAWCDFGPAVHEAVGIPDDEILISGMSIGHADPDAPENSFPIERASVDEFANFAG